MQPQGWEGRNAPDRQIRSLVLSVHAVSLSAVYAGQVRGWIQPDHQSPVFQAPRSWVQNAYPTLMYYNKPARGGHFPVSG
jgi:hypothetical protein